MRQKTLYRALPQPKGPSGGNAPAVNLGDEHELRQPLRFRALNILQWVQQVFVIYRVWISEASAGPLEE